MVNSGGDCERLCDDCGWWCIVVVIVEGDVMIAVGGA